MSGRPIILGPDREGNWPSRLNRQAFVMDETGTPTTPDQPGGATGRPPQQSPHNRPSGAGLSARAAALSVLSDVRQGRRTARESLDDLVARRRLAPQGLSLATELAFGVVRHRLTLAKVLGAYAVHGWQRVSHRLQQILMIGAYQLIWLDGIPHFAAVNEAVNQARFEGGAKAARFVNAVLRQLLRDIEHQRIPAHQADPVRAIPVTDTDCLQLHRPVFTDPAVNPTAHLAETASHPPWLVGRWIHHFGQAAAEVICRAGMRRPTTILRPNRLRIDAAGLVAKLQSEGFAAVPAATDAIAVEGNTAGLMRSEAFKAGLFQPQDLTAMRPVQHMTLTHGQRVVDLCCGVGTKTTQMGELMNNEGLILASDKETGRLDLLQTNCQRLGVTIARPVPAADLHTAVGDLNRLDWILVDAPCSNTGVLARRPEARYRVDARTLAGLAAIQLQLLDLAARIARPETRLLYSTCSLEPEENEKVAAAFVRARRDWTMAQSELTLPSADGPPSSWHDGGYWSSWVRK
jgi:16S rRNA (cytosine967-C5)-methyltransferase